MTRKELVCDWAESFKAMMDPDGGIPIVRNRYAEISPADRISKTKMPGGTASDMLRLAIAVGAFEPDHPYVQEFLNWTIQFSQLAINDSHRWNTTWGSNLGERALTYATLALALAIRDNTNLDEGLLNNYQELSKSDFEECKGTKWEHNSQSRYLMAVQLSLISGDLERTKEMLNCGRAFVWTKKWRDWLAEFIGEISIHGAPPLNDSFAFAKFDAFFDTVRDPNFKKSREQGEAIAISRELLSLQLAAIRHFWIEGRPIARNWHSILISISRP